jgi:hypothetical protein
MPNPSFQQTALRRPLKSNVGRTGCVVKTTRSTESAANVGGKFNASRDGTVTDLEAAKLLLDAWKFRQSHAWSALTRYFLAAVLISIAPYGLDTTLAARLSSAVLALPLVGGLVAIAAVWLFAAEYIRAQTMSHGFRRILSDYGYYRKIDLRRLERLVLKPRIGWTTVYVLAVAAILLALINMAIVWSIVRRA